jgi:hypothetical protein
LDFAAAVILVFFFLEALFIGPVRQAVFLAYKPAVADLL